MRKIINYLRLLYEWSVSLPSWICNTFRRFISNIRLLDFQYAISLLLVEFEKKFAHRFADKWRANNHEHSVVESYLVRHGYWDLMKNVIEQEISSINENNVHDVSPIWVCWWQGEHNMPPIVSICYKRLLAHSGIHPINLITFENYNDYIELPDDVVNKTHNGDIKMAHLSDLLRLKLLTKYGGLWVDLTVYITNGIDDRYFNNVFISLKSQPHYNDTVSIYRWSSFFIASTAENKYVKAIALAMEKYLSTESSVIHYLLIDYLIDLIYKKNYEFKKIVDEMPMINSDIHRLRQIQNTCFDESEWNRMNLETEFFKMSYREFAQEYDDNGQETFYGHIIHNC